MNILKTIPEQKLDKEPHNITYCIRSINPKRKLTIPRSQGYGEEDHNRIMDNGGWRIMINVGYGLKQCDWKKSKFIL